MSLVKSSQNSSVCKGKSIWRFIVLFVVCFVGVLTFSACKLVEDDNTGSSFDASGNLRITSPYVEFNSYSQYGDSSEKLIDDISGSFTWELSYYLAEDTDNINFDQSYYLANFYTDSSYSESSIYNYLAHSNSLKPKYFTNSSDAVAYFGSENITWSGSGFYGLFNNENEPTVIKQVYTPAQRVINNKDLIKFPDYEVVIDGKYYTFRVTMHSSYLGVNVADFNPFVDNSFNYDTREFAKDDAGNDIKSLFTFEYRVGKASYASNSGFKDCPAGFMTYFVDQDNRFMIRFNPWLEEGSTHRYIKVKSLTNVSGRADSLYSNTSSFEAYSMTFSSYSPNSTSIDYGSLMYESSDYYFHTVKMSYNKVTGKNDISTLVGVFPEGRRVVVSRQSLYEDSYDYALQPWTINTHAENVVSYASTLPSITIDNIKYNMNDYEETKTVDKYYDNLLKETLNISCIPSAIKTNSNVFAEVPAEVKSTDCVDCDEGAQIIGETQATCTTCSGLGYVYPQRATFEYKTKASMETMNQVSDYATESFYDYYNALGEKIATRGDLVVVSHAKVNGYKFYANFAKVRNFKISGTFFAGDNFFTGNDQYLTCVDVSVFDKNGRRVCVTLGTDTTPKTYSASTINEDVDATGTKVSSVSRARGVTITFDGAYFEVSGLEYGDYLYFEKLGAPLLEDDVFTSAALLPFGFHSPEMERMDVEALGTNTKVLTLQSGEYFYTDRQDIGIIGTQYAEESNLQVNLYQTNEDGTTTEVSGGLKYLQEGSASYEVIKSVSSYEDDYGYITTNIIISILLPSNATLVGYNADTINNVDAVYYSYEGYSTPQFIMRRNYNPDTFKYEFNETEDLYKYSTSPLADGDVVVITNGDFVSYDEDTYFYNHKTTRDATNYTRFYYMVGDSFSTSTNATIKVLAKVVSGALETWHLITYTKVDVASLNVSYVEEEIDGEIVKTPYITHNGTHIVQYTGTDNAFASNEASELSVVLSVYKTEMMQTVDDKSQDVYVYYDIKKAQDKVYYTSPVAKVQYVENDDATSEEGDLTKETIKYFSEITNFDELVEQGKIVLGSTILSGAGNNYAYTYNEIMGSKLVQSCYYYVLPIGDNGVPTNILAKQYLQDVESANQQQLVTTYYTYQDGSYKVFSGAVKATPIRYIGGGYNNYAYSVTLNATNVNGEVVEITSATQFAEKTSLFDATGILEYVVGSNFENLSSHTTVQGFTADELGTNEAYIEDTYNSINGLSIRFAYTLYVVENDGSVSKKELYYDGLYYYEIISTRAVSFIEQIDGQDVVSTKTLHVYNTAKKWTINVKGTDTFLNSISVTNTINGIPATSSYQETVLENGIPMTKTRTVQRLYLIPTYHIVKGDSETQVYNKVSNGETLAIPSNFSISTTLACTYEEIISQTDCSVCSGSNSYCTTCGGDGKIETTGNSVYAETKSVSVSKVEKGLVRTAQIVGTNQQITLLGKYIQTADKPIVYPSFSYLNTYDEKYTIGQNLDNLSDPFDHYYILDYTSKKLVIEGFPGVSLLAGSPYPNPVVYLSVRHKNTDDAVINISFDIKNAYYVEIMGTQIKTEDSNLIRDFTTYAFKDTITNLSLNEYIEKSYQILDATSLKPVIPYFKTVVNGKAVYEPKLVDQEENPLELTIQDIGINDGSLYLYYADAISANGLYKNLVYMEYIKNDGTIDYKPINYEQDVILWRTDATRVENVPMYDIHSYSQGKDGIIYFDSGVSTDDNALCVGLTGITNGATQSEDGAFNYDQVLISGVTSAYRTKSSEINAGSSLLSGYWLENSLNVMNAYNSNDAYFLSGKESVVILASPTVNVTDQNNNSYIYRFKEWQIYSRYNSEVLYYNRGATEAIETDRYNAILRFSSNEAGYFVILPVYERVFKIDIGTEVIDGALNQGGDIDVLYTNGSDVDVDGTYDDELYLTEYLKTEYNNVEGYYYSNITGSPFLWFTGRLYEEKLNVGTNQEQTVSVPVFEQKTNIYAVRFEQTYRRFFTDYSTGDVTLYFEVLKNGENIIGIKQVNVLSSIAVDYPGLVPVVNYNGLLNFVGKQYFDNYEGFLYKTKSDCADCEECLEHRELTDMLNHTFTATFFFDSVLSENTDNSTSVAVHYDQESKRYYEFDFSVLDSSVQRATDHNFESLLEYLVYWNMKNNSHIFQNSTIFEKIGSKYADYYTSDQISFAGVSTNSVISKTAIARCVTNYFSVLNTFKGTISVGDSFYRSEKGSLEAGELLYDEDGNLYSTIQFKSTYIDRDATVKLVASPDHGYRVEGWYMCVYDEEADVWYTTDKKVENSSVVYSDEILLAEYNEVLDTYFYVTEFYEVHETLGKIYYYDETKDMANTAEVPSKMLNHVRGYFVNQGTELTPNYVQVYKKGNGDDTAYYYDAEFSRIVDITKVEVVQKSFYEAINRSLSDFGLYTLSNVTIYRDVDENNVEHFYREMTTGNIVVDGNNLIINKLHSNVRYVAKFIEIYNEYIFAEPAESSGIEVKAVYYNTSDLEKITRDGEYTIIRTDSAGHNLTGANDVADNPYGIDPIQNTLRYTDFNLYSLDEGETPSFGECLNYFKMTAKITNANGQTIQRYTNESAEMFQKLTYGFGAVSDTYLVNAEDDPLLKGELTLKNMYFDVHTTVYIVVGVRSDTELTVHSLGFPPTYTIEPIIEPTAEFIDYNQSADKDKYDYLYYMFKVTYDRNPENVNASYIVHPNRSDSIAADVLSGNYIDFYDNHFDLYDNFDVKVTYGIDKTGTNAENVFGYSLNLDTYFASLRNKNIISNDICNQIQGRYFKNVSEGLEELCRLLKNPGYIHTSYIIDSADEEKTSLKTSDEIFTAVRNIQVAGPDDAEKMVNYFKAPRLIRRGTQNTINLSSIPIYSYTIQSVTIDGYMYDDNGNLVFTTPEEPTATLADGEEDGQKEPEEIELPKLILNNNKDENVLHALINSLYTIGGTNNYTYLGAGSLTQSEYVYLDNLYNEYDQLIFNDLYTDIEYADGNEDKTILSDLPIAENTIVLLKGSAVAREGYVFAGWYEQKYNSGDTCIYHEKYNCFCYGTECECEDHTCEYQEAGWSELTLMSNELEYPYLSLATADTVIVAMYKKVVNVNVAYDNREFKVELPTGNLDNLGKDVSIITSGNTTTISGQFYFDAYQQLIVSPVGGYRFDGFTYSVSNTGQLSEIFTASFDDKHISYIDIDSNEKKHYEISLNGVMGVSFAVAECLAECQGYKEVYDTVNISLKAKKVVLVNIEVQNYFTYENNKYTHNGWNFGLYDLSTIETEGEPKLLVKTANGSASTTAELKLEHDRELKPNIIPTGTDMDYYNVTDSAGNVMFGKIEGTSLILYGYFDAELSGKLLLVADDKGSSLIRKWYINGYSNYTDQIQNISLYGLDENGKKIAQRHTAAFNINFHYDTLINDGVSVNDYNSNNFFGLDLDNNVYYARAVIEAASEVKISHTFIDNIKNGNAQSSGTVAGTEEFDGVNLYSILAYNGERTYKDGYGNTLTESNSSLVINNSAVYTFSEGTLLNLTLQSKFVEHDGKLYVFLGWFSEGGTKFISSEMSIAAQSATGAYEAKYVRVHKVELNYNDFGQIETNPYNTVAGMDAEGSTEVFAFYEAGGYFYIISGATLEIKAYAVEGYVLPDFVVTPLETVTPDVPLNTKTENIPDTNTVMLTVYEVDRAIRIAANFDEGYHIIINQLLYSSVDMGQDPEYIYTGYSYIVYDERETKALTYVVPKNSEVEFLVKPDEDSIPYYFLGWYIDGILMSTDVSVHDIKYEYKHAVTKDLVIEARFVPYVNVQISSRLVGSSYTTVSGFMYEMEYTDLQTNTQKTYNSTVTNSFISLPAGLVVKLKELTTDYIANSSYEFVAWRQLKGSTILKTFATERNANITLSQDLLQNGAIYIYAHYGSVTTLNLYKTIQIRTEDQALFSTDEILSMFDIIIGYTNVYGERKTIRLGSLSEIENISIALATDIYVSYEISDVVADRYYLDKILVKGSNNSEQVITEQTIAESGSGGSLTVDYGQAYEVNVTATFLPSSGINISTELNGNVQDIFASADDIYYEFVSDGNTIAGYVNSGSKFVNVSASSSYTIKASKYADIVSNNINEQYYRFAGWYNGGTFISSSYELNCSDSSVTSKLNLASGNVELVARFVSVVETVTLNRVFSEGNPPESSTSTLPVNLIGNFYVTNLDTTAGEKHMQTLSIPTDSNTVTANDLVSEQKIIVTATHLAGYDFVGFKINDAEVQDVSGAMYVANSFNTVMQMKVVTGQSLKIDAIYKEKMHTVHYVVTSLNSSSNVATISDYTQFFGASDSTISFTTSNASNFKLFINGKSMGSYNGINHIVSIPSNLRDSDLTVELRFEVAEQYTEYVGPHYVVGTAQNLYSISHTNGSFFILSSDVSKIGGLSRYTNDPYAGYRFETTYRIDYYNDETLVKSSDISNSAPTSTSLTYQNSVYVFEGYYARVGTATGYTYVKVHNDLNTTYVNGVFANVVAKYRKVITIDIQPNIQGASNSVSYVRTPFAIDQNYVCGYTEGNKTSASFAVVAGSVISATFNGKKDINSTSTTYTTNPKTYSYATGSSTPNLTPTYTLTRKNILTTIQKSGTDISGVSCSIQTASTIKTATTETNTSAGDTIVIQPVNEEVDVTFSIDTGGTETGSKVSTMYVTIYSPDGTYYEPLAITATTPQTIAIKTGSTITLSYSLGDHKEFKKFVVNGLESTALTYSYDIINGYSKDFSVTAYFTSNFTVSIEENDQTKGLVSLYSGENSRYDIGFDVKDGYMISAIYLASVDSGADGVYDYEAIYLTSMSLNYTGIQLTSLSGYASNIVYTLKGLASLDSDNKTYPRKMIMSLTAQNNLVVKIEYMHVSKLIIEVKEKNQTQGTYTFYVSEFVDPTVKVADELTLEKLKARIDGIAVEDVKTALNYEPTDLNTFYFEGKAFDETISINHSKRENVLITLNKVTEAQVIVYVVLNELLDQNGNRIYNAPRDGVQVVYDGEIKAVYNQTSEAFTYVSSKSMPLVARDINGQFKFDGYYNGDDKETSGQISASSDYVLLSTDFNSGRLTQNANGVYEVYAIFTEALIEIKVEANYEDMKFGISKNNTDETFIEITTTLGVLDFGELGQLSHIYDEEEQQVIITYPAILASNNVSIFIKAIDFDQKVTDDIYLTQVLKGVSAFYERTKYNKSVNSAEHEYHRFYKFTDAGGTMLGSLYNNVAGINLADYETGTTVTANAKQLYMIEFTYNYFPEQNFYIDMLLTVLDGSSISNITIGSTYGLGLTSFDQAILSYKAEKDMNISVAAHFMEGYEASKYANFETIVYSDQIMVSDRLEGSLLGVADTPGSPLQGETNSAGYTIDSAREWWINKLNTDQNGNSVSNFTPVSKYYNPLSTEADSYLKYQSFNFLAEKNVSFVADFYNIAEEIKYYIFSVLSNLDFDGWNSLRINHGKEGQGYFFTTLPENSKYTIISLPANSNKVYADEVKNYFEGLYQETAGIKNELDAELEKIPCVMYQYVYRYMNLSTQEIVTSIPATEAQYSQTNLHIMMANFGKLDFSIQRIIKNYQEEGILYGEDGLPEGYAKAKYYMIQSADNPNEYTTRYYNYVETSQNGFPSTYEGYNYRLKVDMIEGYFFKGFIMVASGYDNTHKLMGFSGETFDSTGKTFTYIPHKMNVAVNEDGIIEYVSAETIDAFPLSRMTKIYALFEARPYIINLYSYEFRENNEALYAECQCNPAKCQAGYEECVCIEERGVCECKVGDHKLDNEKSMMTDIDISSAIIKGSLIVERGQTTKLTSINLPYIQFAGWATTKAYDNDSLDYEDRFKVAFDTGAGKSSDEYQTFVDKEQTSPLKYNEVLTGYFDADTGAYSGAVAGYNIEAETFASTNGRNNIYLFDLQSDIDLLVYYTYVSYKIKVNLSEIVATYVYKDTEAQISSNDTTGNTSTYITYADYIRAEAGWKNPSAGTYTYSYDWGSNARNAKSSDVTFTIQDKDPYVYTMYDYNGKLIVGKDGTVYPTRIAEHMISAGNEKAYSDINKVLSYKNGKPVIVARPYSVSEGSENQLPYTYQEEKLKAYLGVDDLSAFNGIPQLYSNGFAMNQTDYNIVDGKVVPRLNNIYNYIDQTTGSIKEGLFSILIDEEELEMNDLRTVVVDEQSGTIYFEIKISATETGFPGVNIRLNNVNDVIKANSIEVVKSIDATAMSKKFNGETSLEGFNHELFSNSEFLTNPNYKMPNPDIELIFKWQDNCKPIVANVTLGTSENSQKVALSGISANSKDELSLLKCHTKNICDNRVKTDTFEHEYEIKSYFIVVVENGQYYLKLLQELRENDSIPEEDSDEANVLWADVMTSTAGDTNKKGAVYNVGNYSTQANCQIVSEDTRASIKKLLNKYYNNMFKDLNIDEMFSYTVIDVFEYYKQGINYNFYTTVINSNDLVICQPLLEEHQIRQHNNTGAFGGDYGYDTPWNVWSADKGYDYYRFAYTGFDVNMNRGSFYTTYKNDSTYESWGKNEVGLWQYLRNEFVGTFNGREKYQATFNRLLHTILLLSNEDIASTSQILIISNLVLSRSDPEEGSNVVPSALHDYDQIPLGTAITATIYIVKLLTGQVSIFDIVIIGGVICQSFKDQKTLFDTIANLN